MVALLLAIAAAPACFVDSGPVGQETETSTTGDVDESTTEAPATSSGTTEAETTEAETTEAGTTAGPECPAGDEGCPCDALGQCAGELVCDADLCVVPVMGGECGDGELNEGEACDDGNQEDGDGCNSCELGGALLWQDTHGGDAGSADFAWDVAVDSLGDIYVVGYEVTVNDGDNAWIARYSADGERLWSHSLDSGANGDEYAVAVAIDPDDNPVIVGTEPSLFANRGAWVKGFDRQTGDPTWSVLREPESDLDVAPEDVVVDRDTGGVYVVGGLFDLDTEEPDALVMRVDPAIESIEWERVISAGVMRPEIATGALITSDGDLIACGYFPNEQDIDDRDAWAIRISPDQETSWSRTYSSPNFDTGKGCAVTPGGTLFLTSTQSLADPYDDPGSILGHVIYRINPIDGELNNSPILTELADANGIAAGGDDTIALAGDIPVEGMGLDIWVRKYNALNNALWTMSHNANTGDAFDQAVSVAIDADGNVIAAGGLGLINGGVDIWVGKFSP